MNDILQKITNVLEKYLDKNKFKFFLYGSSAKGDFFFRSDYDIGILGKIKIKETIKYQIEEDFEDIPALIDFADVSEDFKKIAMKNVIWLNKN